jgi:hypothetical protein
VAKMTERRSHQVGRAPFAIRFRARHGIRRGIAVFDHSECFLLERTNAIANRNVWLRATAPTESVASRRGSEQVAYGLSDA